MKRIAILQSNYIPWKGYFDLIDLVDEFVILDAQYTHRDWRNRNRIKTQQGLQWLTVPVDGSGWVSEVLIKDEKALERHWKAIQCSYGKAPYFKDWEELLYGIYSKTYEYLVDLNKILIQTFCTLFEITTPIVESDLYKTDSSKGQRIVDICKQSGATHYVSGPAAKNYLDPKMFGDIELEWMEYDYRTYPQMHSGFIHEVSILDVLFNAGPDKRLIQTNADIRRR